MLLIDGAKYEEWTPPSEDELEQMVKEHAQDIFGEQSIYLDIKTRLKSKLGTGSVPDGFVIFFGDVHRWRIVEVELSGHPLHDHIVAQVGRFISGIENPSTQKKIVDIIYSEVVKNDLDVLKLRKAIQPVETYKFLSDLISKPPILTIIIEEETPGLKEALKILNYPQIKVVEFQTFTREGVGLAVHAHLFEPLYIGPQKGKPPIHEPPPVSPRNQLYQQFFAELVEQYCKQDPTRRILKPLPQSWLGFGAGKTGLSFNWAFTGSRKFSVELYIDTGDKQKNKQYFDRIKENETQLTFKNISWERLDEKKASRLTVYTDGDIENVMNNTEEKERLIRWAIGTMRSFSHQLTPIVKSL